ncbi:MAG TPA: carboxypeptidase regulatory-like domain-containing protein [Vicinamibacterales bacterium]|jgi:hypothetical protein
MRTLRLLAMAGVLTAGCSGTPTKPSPPSTTTTATPPPSPAPAPPMTVTGTVLDEAGLPAAGAAVSIAANGVAPVSAATDAYGRYSVTLPAVSYFWGNADKAGYETTSRDSYFSESPRVLNFRLFRPVRVDTGNSVHVFVTTDGSICGFDDEWFCRTIRVSAAQSGALVVEGTADDSSVPLTLTIGAVDPPCCTATVPKTVRVGDEVLVYVLLPWNGRVTGVTLRPSIR